MPKRDVHHHGAFREVPTKDHGTLVNVVKFGLHALTSAAQRSGVDVAPSCCDLHKLAREQFGDVRGVFDPNNMHHPTCWRFEPSVMSVVDEISRYMDRKGPCEQRTITCVPANEQAQIEARFEAQIFARKKREQR